MARDNRLFSFGIAALVAAVTFANVAVAQEFRDSKTGRVFTPSNVGEDKGPVAPADRAFDPNSQAVVTRGVVEQTPVVLREGTVPLTAGPDVPIVEIDTLALKVVPGERWQLTLFLNNNSAEAHSPVLVCVFENGEKLTEETRVSVPSTAGGERLRLTLHGPRSDIFIDNARCLVASP